MALNICEVMFWGKAFTARVRSVSTHVEDGHVRGQSPSSFPLTLSPRHELLTCKVDVSWGSIDRSRCPGPTAATGGDAYRKQPKSVRFLFP